MKMGSVLYRSSLQRYEAGGSCPRCYLASDERGSGIVAVGGIGKDFENPEQRSDELFAAARALLQDRTADEDEIFPTLKLASKTAGRPFRLLYRGVEMVRVVDEVPILRHRPADTAPSPSLWPPPAWDSSRTGWRRKIEDLLGT